MNPIDPALREQLSAWMDGELPADEARFLQRRLQADPALRAAWERWQLARDCLRGARVRPMPAAFAPAVAAAVAREPRRRGPWPWLAASAAAVLVALLWPVSPGPAPRPSPVVVAPPPATAPAREPVPPALPGPAPADALPAIADLPLVERGRAPWPRSPLATDAQRLEAWLVGHNTLMAEDGLGGFMPYVDVVAHDAGAAAAGDEPR